VDGFERATQLDPMFAYAHYYAAISYSRIKQADRTASHFQTFLQLAPNAPERAAVESIMRALQGR
jgi:Tfp pilus assembly protein PilF